MTRAAEDRGQASDPGAGERFARTLARWSGSTWAFRGALVFVAVWASMGPALSDWDAGFRVMDQIATSAMFLMMFLLQRTQNRDTLALQLKLNELVASNPAASNRVLNAEAIPEEELQRIRRHFQILDELSRRAGDEPLSAEAAYRRHAQEQEAALRSGRSSAGTPTAPG